MARRTLSTKARLAVFTGANGTCHICGGKIQVGEAWDVEHVIPLAICNDDTPDNMRPAHVKCHKAKTRQDKADIARAKRREASHKGARPKTAFAANRAGKFKKTIDGRVIDRATGLEV